MKAKIKNKLSFLEYCIGNNVSIILMAFLFVAIFIYAYYVRNDSYSVISTINFIDGMIFFFQDRTIIITLVLLPMFVMALNVMYRMEKLGSNLIRYSTKKEYVDNLIKYSFKVNTVFFMIIAFIIVIATLCLVSTRISIAYLYEYKTINLLYLIFYLFKLYFIGQWLSILSILVYKLSKRSLGVVIGVCIYLLIFLTTVDMNKTISSVFNMPLLVGDYLKMLNYSSFVIEIICFSIFAILLLLLGKIMYQMSFTKIKKIGEI